jgi:hypothetical protein
MRFELFCGWLGMTPPVAPFACDFRLAACRTWTSHA